jgi:hypothetical protein
VGTGPADPAKGDIIGSPPYGTGAASSAEGPEPGPGGKSGDSAGELETESGGKSGASAAELEIGSGSNSGTSAGKLETAVGGKSSPSEPELLGVEPERRALWRRELLEKALARGPGEWVAEDEEVRTKFVILRIFAMCTAGLGSASGGKGVEREEGAGVSE